MIVYMMNEFDSTEIIALDCADSYHPTLPVEYTPCLQRKISGKRYLMPYIASPDLFEAL